MQFVTRKQARENKSYFGFIVMCAILFSTTLIMGAFMGNKVEPKYSVTLPLNDWMVVMDVIDKSNAPHQTVTAVTKALGDQIKPIYDAEQKRLQDSISASKVKPKQ